MTIKEQIENLKTQIKDLKDRETMKYVDNKNQIKSLEENLENMEKPYKNGKRRANSVGCRCKCNIF